MRGKKWLKITGITVLVIGILALAAHLFIVSRARQILNYIVMQASDDRYMVKSGKVRFKYNPLTISAKNLEIIPVDPTREQTFYITSADSLSLQVTRLIPLLSRRNLSLENVKIIRPVVKVYDRDTTPNVHKTLNQALDDIQHALLTTLTDFSIRNCRIDDAGITYHQNKKDTRPLFVNHVWLNIRNLHTMRHNEAGDNPSSFEADINLQIKKPFIQLPDPSVDLYVDNVFVDTRSNVFTVNMLNLYERNDKGTVDSINLSKISLKQFNWNRWLKEGLIEIDSLKANNGTTFFDFSEKQIFTKKGQQHQVKLKRKPYVDFLLHHVEINKIDYGLRIGSPSGTLNVQLAGDSLAIKDISISNDSLRPVKVGSVAFRLSDFENQYDSRKNESTFDRLIIENNNLQLINYRRSLDFRNVGAGSSITIPSLRLLNFSLDDLLQYRLVADKLVLEKPALIIDAQQSGNKKRDANEVVASITTLLKPSLSIRQLSIHDAAIILLTNKKNSGRLSIEQLNTEINARQLLQARSVLELISSATELSSTGFKVSGPNINLFVERSSLNKARDGVFLQHVQGKIGNALQVDLEGVSASNNTSQLDITKLQQIPVDNLGINAGTINIDLDTKSEGGKEAAATPSFIIGHVKTGPLKLNLNLKHGRMQLQNAALNGTGIKTGNKNASWNIIALNTAAASFSTERLLVNASGVQVTDPGFVTVTGLNIQPLEASSIKMLSIPLLSVQTDFKSTGDIKLETDKVVITEPNIEIAKKPRYILAASPVPLPAFSIKTLLVSKPSVKWYDEDSFNKKQVVISDGVAEINNLSTNKKLEHLTASAIKATINKAVFSAGSESYSPATVNILARNFLYDAFTKKVSALVDTALVTGIDLALNNKSKTAISGISAGVSDYSFSSKDSFSLDRLLANPNWWSSASQIKQSGRFHTMTVYHPYARSGSIMGFDSLEIIPKISRDSFWNSFPFEKDYNTFRMGATTFTNWSFTGPAQNRQLHAAHVRSENFNLLTERNKTKRPDTVAYRPLLAKSLERIPVPFFADTIQLVNASVKHNVIAEKTGKEGTIFFTGINGNIYDVKNYNITPPDTLRFRLTAKIMGEGEMITGFRQSYTDSLQGFSLQAKMGRLDLVSLNKLLVPVLSVKIDRGITDSLMLSVGANDFIAYGSMDMRYRGLKVALLKKGEKKYFLSGFFNTLINAVIHTNGNATRNVVFQERLRNKSIFNYWGKIAINGLLSNLGIKRDKKQIKKYNKAVNKDDMPAVDEGLL